MLPTILAKQLQQGLRDYVETTFPTTNAPFRGSIKRMAERPGGLFLPPFIAARLPFRIDDGDKSRFFEGFELDRQPYAHQRRAYERLGGDYPSSALIATGTGSGKTECFMHPILDYCYRRRNDSPHTGVMAVVIYPMNALASDQARRFAEMIARHEKLRDLRVGMYVGVGRKSEPVFDDPKSQAAAFAKYEATKVMGPDSVITDRQTLLDNPPDILLTNYKMLDYLLDRPADARIWKNNDVLPQPLKFLVVDELHTFDGAQGTDLACLVRRLKSRLRLQPGELCCVGSSATLGGESDVDAILDYASQIFGETFDRDAIIGEDRLAASEFFPRDDERAPVPVVSCNDVRRLAQMTATSTPGEYLAAAAQTWLDLDSSLLETLRAAADAPGEKIPEFADARVRLGDELKRLPVFCDLVASLDGKYRSVVELAKNLRRAYPKLLADDQPRLDDFPRDDWSDDQPDDQPDARRLDAAPDSGEAGFEAGFDSDDLSAASTRVSASEATLWSACVDSLFALASFARSRDATGAIRPFVDVRAQLWFRELRRLVAKVSADDVRYALSDELNAKDAKSWLPAINCRECGATGWAAVVSPKNVLESNLQEFYNLFFKGDDRVRYFFPWGREDKVPDSRAFARAEICPKCMRLYDAPSQSDEKRKGPVVCDYCGEETVSAIFPTEKSQDLPGEPKSECPFCESKNSLALIGLRCATETSATLSQLFASRFNDDKKTLAFSDSVQDAAHRAGFFTARARRFTLRGAIQRFANSCAKEYSLEEFSYLFVDYWVERFMRPSIADPEERLICAQLDFIGTFIPRGMTFNNDYDNVFRKVRDPEFWTSWKTDRSFKTSFNRIWNGINSRMRYEILLEYGLRNRIGRTLRKTSSSCLVFPKEMIAKAADELASRVASEAPGLSCDAQTAGRAIVGVLDLMIRNGSIYDIVFEGYLNNEGKTFMLTQAHNAKDWWLPGRTGQNTPRFLTEAPVHGSRLFDPITRGKYWDWLKSCVNFTMQETTVFPKLLLDAMTNAELIERKQYSYGTVYCVNRHSVMVTTHTSTARCECGAEATFGDANAEFWVGAPCPRRQCKRALGEIRPGGDNYFRRLYADGDVVRLVARDHTGLLERESREALEADFKRPDVSQTDASNRGEARRPWDPNVLSCTPTLEMGVDIGDLSTVELCGVPRTPAQFQQRVGRAGRRDGNSLALTIATVRPRDLFYYADPSDMIEGAARPPKIFLDAPAVLQRQFIAFCLDSWIADKRGEEVEIPHTLKDLLNTYKKYGEQPPSLVAPFPFNFLCYTQNNQKRLLASFFELFRNDHVSESTKEKLAKFITVDATSRNGVSQMGRRILDELGSQLTIVKSLETRLESIKKQIAFFQARPKDPSFDVRISELTMEKKAVIRAIEDANDKVSYNFMTDEALLPNYAFPEEGVVLKAILFRKDDKAETPSKKPRRPNKTPYEYARSAASALSEFAPSNNFYVDGRKLQINQIDLGSAERAQWRMCPNCAHMEQEDSTKPVASACPKCGDHGWCDVGQVKTLLKARVVCSNMDESDCQIGDESDDRSSTFYFRQLLVEVEKSGQAYKIETPKFPFAFQYVEKATLREVNFGESGVLGEKMAVDGVNYSRQGFKICGECGFVQGLQGRKRLHAGYCSQSSLYSMGREPQKPEECFFLFREFSSEALRILIPASATKGCEKEGESFAAAFMLGLTEYFGNIDHLRASVVSEPDVKTGSRRLYLIAYDSVPGGTGYLNQFVANPNAIRDVLSKALERLTTCSCRNDPDKDGCFRCLLAYRQGGSLSSVSRSTAILQLTEILAGGEIEKTDWGDIDIDKLHQSELERLFVSALGNLGSRRRRVEVAEAVVNGRPGFQMTITERSETGAEEVGKCVWDVEPQVDLNSDTDGISVASRADFVFYPRAFYPRPQEGEVDPLLEHKPIAVFTDGFSWHETIVADDTLKRNAISLSGKYRVWSISYNDVQGTLENAESTGTQTLDVTETPNAAFFQKYLNNTKAPSIAPQDAVADARNKPANFQLLLEYLSRRDAETVFQKNAIAFSFATLSPQPRVDRAEFELWRVESKKAFEQFRIGSNSDFQFGEKGLFNAWRPLGAVGLVTVYSGWKLSRTETQQVDVVAVLDDELTSQKNAFYQAEWQGFWRLVNLLQFNPNFAFATTRGLSPSPTKPGIYWELPIPEKTDYTEIVSDANVEAWKDNVLDLLTPEEAEEGAFANACVGKGVPAPDMCWEDMTLEDLGKKGRDVALTVVFGWRDRKIAYVPESQKDDAALLQESGWTVLTTAADLETAGF